MTAAKRKKTRASALVIVLWMVMIMTSVAVVTARMTMLDSKVSQLSVEQIRCRWAARAGIETAAALLAADDRSTDTLVDIWADNDAQLSEVPLEGCTFTAQVVDESGKLNFNTASENQLAYLPDMTAEILDSMLDWRDQDDEIREAGAELGYYLNLTNGYYCRDGQIQTVRELLRVKGMEEKYFYGPEDSASAWSENEGWIYYLTSSSAQVNVDSEGNPRINVNRSSERQLRDQLSLSRDNAEWIVKNRQFSGLLELTQEKQTSGSSQNQTGSRSSGSQSQNGSQNQSGSQKQNDSQREQSQTGDSPQNASGSSNSSRDSGRNNTNPDSGSSRSASSQEGRSGSSSSPASGSQSSSTSGSGQQQQQQQQQQSTEKPLDWKTLLSKADQMSLSRNMFVTGRLNVNTAPLMVLTAFFEGNRQLAESLVAYREGLETGIEDLEELSRVEQMSEDQMKKIIDQVAFRSSVFSIKSVGVSSATGQKVEIEAIINRDNEQNNIIYWREG